jgi:hypothetical protein
MKLQEFSNMSHYRRSTVYCFLRRKTRTGVDPKHNQGHETEDQESKNEAGTGASPGEPQTAIRTTIVDGRGSLMEKSESDTDDCDQRKRIGKVPLAE